MCKQIKRILLALRVLFDGKLCDVVDDYYKFKRAQKVTRALSKGYLNFCGVNIYGTITREYEAHLTFYTHDPEDIQTLREGVCEIRL